MTNDSRDPEPDERPASLPPPLATWRGSLQRCAARGRSALDKELDGEEGKG